MQQSCQVFPIDRCPFGYVLPTSVPYKRFDLIWPLSRINIFTVFYVCKWSQICKDELIEQLTYILKESVYIYIYIYIYNYIYVCVCVCERARACVRVYVCTFISKRHNFLYFFPRKLNKLCNYAG